MVAPGMLQNPSVRNWLGGIEPAWTLLDQASFDALQRPPHPIRGPIRLTYDLPVEDIQRSAVARNTLILLRAAAEGPGLKLERIPIMLKHNLHVGNNWRILAV